MDILRMVFLLCATLCMVHGLLATNKVQNIRATHLPDSIGDSPWANEIYTLSEDKQLYERCYPEADQNDQGVVGPTYIVCDRYEVVELTEPYDLDGAGTPFIYEIIPYKHRVVIPDITYDREEIALPFPGETIGYSTGVHRTRSQDGTRYTECIDTHPTMMYIGPDYNPADYPLACTRYRVYELPRPYKRTAHGIELVYGLVKEYEWNPDTGENVK